MEYLFVLADIKQRSVLVVGGGEVAARKVIMLKRSGAKIKLVASVLCPELKQMKDMNDLLWIGQFFKENMLRDVFLVVVATDDKCVNDHVYQSAERYNKFVNIVDDRSKCSFIFPSIIDRSPVLVAVSSSGKAPVLVRILREKLESLLPSFLGPMANLIGRWRQRVKNHISNITMRRQFWEKVLHSNIFSILVGKGLLNEADRFLSNFLFKKNDNILEHPVGSVAIVGAGPGDSGLFTLRGLQMVQEADIVLYDYLVTSEILDLVRRDAKKICVGKRGGCKNLSTTQNEINTLLITLAKEGNKVVRLKGGDPFLFGRGGEELEEVIQSGIPCQVVPGVTSASSVSIYAGIPLTHRDYAHSVTFTTGHFLCSSSSKCDYHFLNYSYHTLVIYMGTMYASKIRALLFFHGCDVNTSVAIVSRGTCQDQKVVVGILGDLEYLSNVSCSPSLLIIGNVVNLHRKMNWLDQNNIEKYEFTSLINLL